MPGTVQAALVAAFAVLPGALYTWAVEQQAGRWGATAADRLQRFVGVSAFFFVCELPALYQFYRSYVANGHIAEGRPLPAWTWLGAAMLVALPVGAGRLVGRAVYDGKPWVRHLTGPSPAPRAWDSLFAAKNRTGWLILRLKDERWVGGLWGESESTQLTSYAAGYPEAQDLLIAYLAEMSADGQLLVDADQRPVLTGVALLVRWDEVAYAQFVPA